MRETILHERFFRSSVGEMCFPRGAVGVRWPFVDSHQHSRTVEEFPASKFFSRKGSEIK